MTVAAFDLGGTKTAAALVEGGRILAERRVATPRTGSGEDWVAMLAGLAAPWAGRYTRAAAAVTGLITEGRWSAVNPETLPIPAGFPLAEALAARLSVPALALNDAQAAAWGEHRFGAGRGADIVLVTVSTGIGAGVVAGGRLLTGRHGLAGHLGRLRAGPALDAPTLEDFCSGRALARRAGIDAAEVFARARVGDASAEAICRDAAAALAAALVGVQALIAPERIVIGGGIGLSEGFIDRLRAALAPLPPILCPALVPAALGNEAGLIGVADYAARGGGETG